MTLSTALCNYPACTRKAERGDRCYPHQPQFVEACALGDHCVCFEDRAPHGCCTCGAVKPFWREIHPGVFMPAVGV